MSDSGAIFVVIGGVIAFLLWRLSQATASGAIQRIEQQGWANAAAIPVDDATLLSSYQIPNVPGPLLTNLPYYSPS